MDIFSPTLPVTAAPFQNPPETPTFRIGRGGLNLRDSPDLLAPEDCLYATNTDDELDGVTARYGQTGLATTGAGTITGIGRLDRPSDAAYTRFVGRGTSVYYGQAGALTDLNPVVPFSGDPLTFLPHRPTLSGAAWMFIADRANMLKVRADGTFAGLGRTPPAAPVVTLANERTVIAAQFDATDGTNAATWTGKAGLDASSVPLLSGVPTAADATGKSGNAVVFTTKIGAAKTGYTSFWGHGKNLDLTVLADATGAAYAASDDDLLHLWLRLDNPAAIDEVRLYFVCADVFSPNTLPGTLATENQDFFVKSFRADSFAQFVAGTQTQDDAAQDAQTTTAADEDLRRQKIGTRTDLETEIYGPGPDDDRTSWEDRRASIDPNRRRAAAAGAAAGQWVEFGTIGAVLRRGDFQRFGSTAGRGWATLTGIIVYVKTNKPAVVALALDHCYLTGGSGPDTSEPGSAQIDYKVTHYDTLTGDESNGSAEMPAANFLDAARRAIDIDPAGSGDAWVRQRAYRRGGTLGDDWRFVGENTADGAVLRDELTDAGIAAATTVPTDHYKAVPTVDANGNTILGQPLPTLWGPVAGMIMGCGDPYRPGHLYWCHPDEPGHWGAANNYEVCSPSEQLMNGCVWGDQAYVFSRHRLYAIYPNLTGTAGEVIVNPTNCTPGLASRWAMAPTPYGLAYVHETGAFLSDGRGTPELLSDKIKPLFQPYSVTKYGRAPIDFTVPTALTLRYAQHRIWLTFQDTTGARRVYVYHLMKKTWRPWDFGRLVSCVGVDGNTGAVLLGGATTGAVYSYSGYADDGVAIAAHLRTGDWDAGRPREDKLLGDVIVDADLQQTTLTVQTILNNQQVSNAAQVVTTGAGRGRYVFQPFGTEPQRARNLGLDVSWEAAAKRPVIYLAGCAVTPEPDVTTTRATQWDDGGAPTEQFLTGVMIECDTFGAERPLVIERDLAGVISTVYTGAITSSGRHRFFLSWPELPAHLMRVRPTDPDEVCPAWILYKLAWIATAEPARIAGWDTNWEAHGDTYYTGVDIECNTFGVEKTVAVYVDQTLIGTYPITANGRQLVHLTLNPPGRGHLYRFVATDANPGLLYAWKWQLAGEPSEQANWNQNYTIAGSLSDKYVKGVLLECDTYGATKLVEIQVDGVTVESIAVNQTGRGAVHQAFAQQYLGRVFRLLPTDANPGRLYSHEWIFDEEPLALTRWETQETDHGIAETQIPITGTVTVKSQAEVTLTLTIYSQTGVATVQTYPLPSTAGAKIALDVPFAAAKGRLFKYLFTSEQPFTLYREEATVTVAVWGGGSDPVRQVRPFGNDDFQGRGMNHASRVAAASNTADGREA